MQVQSFATPVRAGQRTVGGRAEDKRGVTVLHRCDAGTGCCPQDPVLVQCGPASEETVRLVVMVADVVSNVTAATRVIRATNHTRCECQEVNYNF
uniref:Uncharacterized protein n=1 Tax=Timema cristinae TaxID=61476 RepID=A0A7R9CUQ7_TIMCR|nr:unnamed protein product [Timema cristinae]